MDRIWIGGMGKSGVDVEVALHFEESGIMPAEYRKRVVFHDVAMGKPRPQDAPYWTSEALLYWVEDGR